MAMASRAKQIIRGIAPHGAVVLYRNYKSKPRNLNFCPICETESRFANAGGDETKPRPQARCPNCRSLERHRLLWLFIVKKIGLENIAKAKKMLHFAAEPSFKKKFRPLLGKKYITADLYAPADAKVDITDIQFKDNSFSVIISSHVLEHIVDDAKAIKELHRVLAPGGHAILLVPQTNKATTYEDFSIKTKAGRLKAFDQADHVRKYGADFQQRLVKAGYKVKLYRAQTWPAPKT